jgi:6-phosphogluconolactonase
VADVRVCANPDDLASRAAGAAAALINDVVRSTGRCSLVLSGGHTPRILYTRWADGSAGEIPWPSVHVFIGDERFVPFEDSRSNFRMAREALLDHVAIPAANIQPMPTSMGTPELAAAAYEATLRSHFGAGRPAFDLLLLGLGSDGHTASLFPQTPALGETTRWVRAVTAPADPPSRITLTLPALNAATHTYFLVDGSEKAPALAHVLSGTADVRTYPAAGIRNHPIWWVDRNAAALLRPEPSHGKS